MTNRYPGICCNCLHDVAKGEGLAVKDRLGWQVKHVDCGAKPAPKAPDGFWMPNTLESFTTQVNALTEPGQLNHVRDVLNRIVRQNEKHPLRDEKWGFASCYTVLNKRAEVLEFGQKNSDKMYYRPLGLVATKPL